MNAIVRPAPVRKEIRVRATPERAFEIFTARMGSWWPGEHNTGSTPILDVVIEPREGGRWFTRHDQGVESQWGKVLVWAPPARLVLGWQLNAQFQYDAALVTEVEITFTPEEGGTRLVLEHRHLERVGEAAHSLRAQVDSERGWSMLLALYGTAVDRAAA